MARTVSLNARTAFQAQQTSEVGVLLVTIAHPDLPVPQRFSTDPTQLLSVEPLVYGTISQGVAFPFVLASAVLPDDRDDKPPATALVFENVSQDVVAAIRSVTSPSTVTLTAVLASTPDFPEASFTNMRTVRASYDAAQSSVDISREPFTSEPMPAGRMTRDRFAGLQ